MRPRALCLRALRRGAVFCRAVGLRRANSGGAALVVLMLGTHVPRGLPCGLRRRLCRRLRRGLQAAALLGGGMHGEHRALTARLRPIDVCRGIVSQPELRPAHTALERATRLSGVSQQLAGTCVHAQVRLQVAQLAEPLYRKS